MNNERVIIPEGWTYFAHRTNTSRWDSDPFNMDKITTNKIMSVVTESDIRDDLRAYGKNYILSYSSGQGIAFEIRCLICDLSYLMSLDDTNELKKVMLKEYYYDRRNFGGCYGQRHHSIPPEEELVVLGVGNHDEIFNRDENIIWTIPRRFIEFYKKEIENKNYRIIYIQKLDTMQK